MQSAGSRINGRFLLLRGGVVLYVDDPADDAVRAIGIPAFQFMALFQVPLVLSIVNTGAARRGETRYPLIFTIIGVLFIRVLGVCVRHRPAWRANRCLGRHERRRHRPGKGFYYSSASAG